MDEDNARDQIAQLEAHIESLNEHIARCRKIALGARIAIAAGAIWFAFLLFQVVFFDATGFVAALTAVLGGIVLLGSNATTWEQTELELHVAEKARAEMIGGIELKLVAERPTLH